MLEPTPLAVTDLGPRRARCFTRCAERTEATNLLVLRMNDEVRCVLCADNGDAAGHAFGFPAAARRPHRCRRWPLRGQASLTSAAKTNNSAKCSRNRRMTLADAAKTKAEGRFRYFRHSGDTAAGAGTSPPTSFGV